MKDKADRITLDIFTGRKAVGRPRKYKNDAEKMRLYRLSKKTKEVKLS